MADTSRTLTQWEIDNLLNQIPDAAAAPGEIEDTPVPARDRGLARTIKTYDFRRPDKFSKEQWQTLTTMHETFARMIGAQFSSRMRTLVSVRLSSIDQGLYEEWQLQIPSETACYVFSLAPLAGNIVVEFNHDVATEVIDRLLGGTAVLPVREHDLSDIELVLLRSFGRSLGTALGEMWGNVAPIEPEVQEFGLDASLIQVAGANDVVVTAFFEVNLGNRLGAMSICMPYTVLEQIASKLSAQVWLSGTQSTHDARVRRIVRAVVGAAPIEVVVELGSTEVPAHSVAELVVGDTLVLDGGLERPLRVSLGGHQRFLGRPGMVGNRVALRVSEVTPPKTYDFDEPVQDSDRHPGGRIPVDPAAAPVAFVSDSEEENLGAA